MWIVILMANSPKACPSEKISIWTEETKKNALLLLMHVDEMIGWKLDFSKFVPHIKTTYISSL